MNLASVANFQIQISSQYNIFYLNCIVDGIWGEWSLWEECSLTCGNGTQNRNRTCIGPFFGGAECDGDTNENRLCNGFFCPGEFPYL